MVLDATDVAAERAYGGWRADPAGSALLDGLDLARSSAGVRARVAEEIRGWQSDVLDLVREQGAGKRGAARALSFGINGLGLSLMVVVFASTGGLTGAEVGIAGGTAILAQKLLEAVFGDDAVRRLTRTARERLAERVRVVLDDEALRYTAQLDALGTADADETARSVLEAARAVEAAARVERSARPAVAAGVDGRTAVGRHAARLLRGAGWTPLPPDEPLAAPGDEAAEPARRPGFWRRLLGGEQA